MIYTPPQEVIVVEGRDDTKRLIEVFGSQVKTIETNGSALSRPVQKQISHAAQEFGIIIFTDPDYQGDRIRRLITQAVPTAKQAYLTPQEARGNRKHDSLGIEHAKPQAFVAALEAVMTPQKSETAPVIPTSVLVSLGLIGHPQAKQNRQRVAQHFHLGHLNGKKLQKQLARYQISQATLEEFLEEGGD